MPPSLFIKSMHPKTEIRFDPTTIRRVLANDWWGQLKIHGHKAQIHIHADKAQPTLVYNRMGKLHEKEITPAMELELRRILTLKDGYSVIEGEWLKREDKLFLFDYIKQDEQILDRLTYEERWQLLPRLYISPRIETLPVLKTLEDCLAILDRNEDWIEGLVF